MITIEDIEEKALDYIAAHPSLMPKFVLLDSKSYDAFNETLIPKERKGQSDPGAKISKIQLYRCLLDVLKVDTEKTLFEVVGQ